MISLTTSNIRHAFNRAKWRQHRRDENKRRHAEPVPRAPGWDDTLPHGIISISIRTAAHHLLIKQGELFSWLSERGWIARDDSAAGWVGAATRSCADSLQYAGKPLVNSGT
jgi:phage antirepressor YoqD-like protein